jgi:hypothetical protein
LAKDAEPKKNVPEPIKAQETIEKPYPQDDYDYYD